MENTEDNIIENKKKQTRIKPTKKDLYDNERLEILDKLNKILGITKDNYIIYLYDIENDKEINKKIYELESDVRKYFRVGNWGIFRKESMKGNHVVFAKSIYKEMNYSVISTPVHIKRDNKVINTTKYTILKIEN